METMAERMARKHISVQLLLKAEAKAGFSVVKVGGAGWLPAKDWDLDSVVSFDAGRNEVRLILLAAKQPRQGALKRLLAAIHADGKRAVVLAPNDTLAAILKRRGWHRKYEDGDDHWRPPEA